MIIGLTSKKRGGKDTCGNYLQKQYGFSRYSFASPIKRFVEDAFLMNDDQINGHRKEEVDPRWGISSRKLQQYIGTELMREYLPKIDSGYEKITSNNLWLLRFKYWYESLPTPLNVVITDVRFLNEFELIKSMGGYIVRIERAGLFSKDQHASEQEMEMIIPDYTIMNDSTITHLETEMGLVYREILEQIHVS